MAFVIIGSGAAGVSAAERLRALGKEVVLEISQIGKECHSGCAIFHQIGKCIMPREGVFARVIRGGNVEVGDPVEIA